jgi:hypothetical protein
VDNVQFEQLIEQLSAISGAIEDLTTEFRDTFRYPIQVEKAEKGRRW